MRRFPAQESLRLLTVRAYHRQPQSQSLTLPARPRPAGMTNIDQFRVLECGIILMESARWIMVLPIVAVVFGVFAIGLIVLLIYKSTLAMHRDDQLFLDDASSHMHAEQTELLTTVDRLTIPDARAQHRVRSISGGARGDVVLPEAERGTVAFPLDNGWSFM